MEAFLNFFIIIIFPMNQKPVKPLQSLPLLRVRLEKVHINSVLEYLAAWAMDVSHIEIVSRMRKPMVEKLFKIICPHFPWGKAFHVVWQSIQVLLFYVISFSFLIGLCLHVISLSLAIFAWITRLAIVMDGVEQYARLILAELSLLNYYLFWLLFPFDILLIYHIIVGLMNLLSS